MIVVEAPLATVAGEAVVLCENAGVPDGVAVGPGGVFVAVGVLVATAPEPGVNTTVVSE